MNNFLLKNGQIYDGNGNLFIYFCGSSCVIIMNEYINLWLLFTFLQNFAAQYDGVKAPDPGPGPMVRTPPHTHTHF